MAREDVEQDGLAEGLDGGAGGALHETPGDEAFERSRKRAHDGGGGEAEEAPELQAAAAEAGHEPAGHGHGDGGGQDIEGDGPGDLVLGGGERALHLRQDGGDGEGGRVERGRGDDHGDQHKDAPRYRERQRGLVFVGRHLSVPGASPFRGD
jgi:hypothetical protein